MKQTGMLVVSLRVHFGFWSRLGYSGKAPKFYAAKVSFRVPRRNTELCEEKQNSNFLFNLFCLRIASVIISLSQRFLQIVENIIIRLISDNKGSVIQDVNIIS